MALKFNDIATFVGSWCAVDPELLSPDTIVQSDLGIYGSDLIDMMQLYSDKFNVDMAKFVWYFHTQEEGINIISDDNLIRIQINL